MSCQKDVRPSEIAWFLFLYHAMASVSLAPMRAKMSCQKSEIAWFLFLYHAMASVSPAAMRA
jgi:hypothetical protein